MDSLEFGNLPLIEVTCNLILAEQRVLGWDDLANARAALKPQLPLVTDFFSGLPPSPIGFVLGAAPGASFESDSGSKLEIRTDRITSSWRRRDPESSYVRFQALYDALGTAVEAAGNPGVAIVNMVYVNRAPREHGEVRELIDGQAFPGLFPSEIKDYNVAWQLESGIEFRLQISSSDALAVISTAAGTKSDGNWQAELKFVHSSLQEQFLSVITDQAKKVWAWKQS